MNNKGMTLIEVIITVTLLVLVSGFILSSFVASMRMSTKSREMHRATTMAQNLMEGINLKTAEELAYQFNYPQLLELDPSGVSSVQIDNFFVCNAGDFQHSIGTSVGELYEVVDPSDGSISYEKVVVGSTNADTYETYLADVSTYGDALRKAASAYLPNAYSRDYDFLKDDTGKYIYYIRNLENDGSYYNAKIVLDGSPYRAGGSSALNTNSESLIAVPTIDSSYDAVEVMGPNYDEKAVDELLILGEIGSINTLNKEIIIDVTDQLMHGMGGKTRTKVDVKYVYYFDSAARDANGKVLESSKYELKVDSPFSNEGNEDAKQLRSIYLYYYMLYDNFYCRDTVIVNNPNNRDIDLFVIKQETGSRSQMMTNEGNYDVNFNVKETTLNDAGKSHITLHTNWNQNLYSLYGSCGGYENPNQVNLMRNNIVTTTDMFQMTDLKDKQVKDRMFNVIIDIYKSEDMTTEEFNLQSDVADWFDSDNYLITVTGSLSE